MTESMHLPAFRFRIDRILGFLYLFFSFAFLFLFSFFFLFFVCLLLGNTISWLLRVPCYGTPRFEETSDTDVCHFPHPLALFLSMFVALK